MVNVDRPLVAVLSDNARHDFVERVPTLAAALQQMLNTALNYGSGLHDSNMPKVPVTGLASRASAIDSATSST